MPEIKPVKTEELHDNKDDDEPQLNNGSSS